MSEMIQKLTRALAQAQSFANEAPLEALARARLVLSEANREMANAYPADADRLAAIAARAASRVQKYEAIVASWDRGVRARADLFLTHEVERLQRPIASKI